MATARDERHRHGQHYTPDSVAAVLAAFAVRSASDTILDPSCGDGRLLRHALNRKIELGAADLSHVFGIDRSEAAIREAVKTGATVACADFFDIRLRAPFDNGVMLPDQFDAIVGNPPYVRQEFITQVEKRRIARSLVAGRSRSWSGRSDLYVYFFARAADFLRPGGRLVFLTASSWLDVAYGSALRGFLLANFRIVAVVESAAEGFFADASINTAITVLEREPDSSARQASKVRFVQLAKPLAEIAGAQSIPVFTRSIEDALDSETTADRRVRVVRQPELAEPDARWGKYLRAADVYFDVIERGRGLLGTLAGFASVRFGIKTGANDFFYLIPDGARMKRLADVASVRRGITTGANEFFYVKADEASNVAGPDAAEAVEVEDGLGVRHLIEREYLAPAVYSLKEVPGIVLKNRPASRFFFNCSDPRGKGALDYIRAGERAGYHRRPTCATREPWYCILKGKEPAPLIFPSKVGERWLIALNEARFFEDKKLYGIFPHDGVSPSLLAALLNSTWARYYAEMSCRQLTGAQAIADIDVAVAEKLLLPDPRFIAEGQQRRIESALLALSDRPVFSIFEEVKRDDRRLLDELVLAAIGFADAVERSAALRQLYEAATDVVRIRLAKSKVAPSGVTSFRVI